MYFHRCGQSTDLVVHHGTYQRRGNESKADLFVLCKYCHDEFHQKYGKSHDMLELTVKFVQKQDFAKKESLLDY